jgi:hypothetical protein
MRKLKRLGGIGFPDDPIDPVVQCQAVMRGTSGSDDPIRLPKPTCT